MKINKTSPPPKFPIGLNHWKNKLFFAFIFIILLIIIIIYTLSLKNSSINNNYSTFSPEPSVLSSYYLSCPFTQTDYLNDSKNLPEKINAQAVLVSHHLLAKDLIIKTLSTIKDNNQTIILIGPNHHNIGGSNIQTTDGFWKTKFGDINPDKQLIRGLIYSQIADLDLSSFQTEHSICSLVSFVKIYFPKSRIIPLILKANTSIKQSRNLADFLAENCQNCLLIASVDFSHEASPQQAKENDRRSLQILSELNEEKLNQVVSDSTGTLQTLISYVKTKGIKQPKNTSQSNSAEISKIDFSEVTSYIFMVF